MQIFGQWKKWLFWRGVERNQKLFKSIKKNIQSNFSYFFLTRMKLREKMVLERTFRIFALEKSLPNIAHCDTDKLFIPFAHEIADFFSYYSTNTAKILCFGIFLSLFFLCLLLFFILLSLFDSLRFRPSLAVFSSPSLCFIRLHSIVLSSFCQLQQRSTAIRRIFFAHAKNHKTFILRPNSFQRIYSLVILQHK